MKNSLGESSFFFRDGAGFFAFSEGIGREVLPLSPEQAQEPPGPHGHDSLLEDSVTLLLLQHADHQH